MKSCLQERYQQLQSYPKRAGFTYLYALTDTGQCVSPSTVKYVGKTMARPLYRFHHHISNCRRGNTYRDRWIRKLLDSGSEPRMHILALVPNQYGAQAEMRLISSFKRAGAKLTNLTDGGEGAPRHFVSEEARQKVSLAQKGIKEVNYDREALQERARRVCAKRWADPEVRKRHSELMKE